MQKINRLIRLLALIAIMLILPTSHASAALVRCRVDPIFVLSNGDVVAVTADVYADPIQIDNVTYTLHVPHGVTVRQVVHTARGFGIKEIYQVHQDSPPGIYVTDTVVNMRNTATPVPVIVYTRLNGVFFKAVSGYSGQPLITMISRR